MLKHHFIHCTPLDITRLPCSTDHWRHLLVWYQPVKEPDLRTVLGLELGPPSSLPLRDDRAFQLLIS